MARIFFFTSVSVVCFCRATVHAAHFNGKRISNHKGIPKGRQRQTRAVKRFHEIGPANVWKMGISQLWLEEGHTRMVVS
jgi:hypothetical protein